MSVLQTRKEITLLLSAWRGTTKLPDRPLAEFFIICLIAFGLRASASHASVLADSDEGLYVVQAQQWLRGGLPYVAVWDQHPIGLPAILAAGGWLTGNVLLAARWGSTLAVAATAWMISHFQLPGAARRAGGAVGALLYIVCMSQIDGLAAQTEVFNNALVCLASLLLFRAATQLADRTPRDLPMLAIAGLALGCALQVKYVVLPECVLFCSAFLLLSHRRFPSCKKTALEAAILVAGGVMPTAMAVGLFAITGHLDAFMQANVFANVTYVEMTPSRSELLDRLYTGLAPLISLLLTFVGCVAFVLGRRAPHARSRHRMLLLWLVLWMTAAGLDICLPDKFWTHYFLALIPPLCVAASLASVLLYEWRPRGLGAALGLVVVAVLLVAPTRIMVADLQEVAKRTRVDVPRRVAEDMARLGAGKGVDIY